MHYHLSCVDENHPIAALDARVKILASFAILVMVLSYKGFIFPAILTACGLLLCVWMKMPLKTLIVRLSEPVFVVAVLIILKTFFMGTASAGSASSSLHGSASVNAYLDYLTGSAGNVLFTLKIFGAAITAHKDGLIDGLLIGFRIIGAVVVVGVLGYSMPFEECISGLRWFRIPQGFIEVLMFAYRYIFTLFEEAQVIYLAQKNRLGYSSTVRGVRSFGTLAGALTIKAFDQSQNITVAMVQRGFDGTLPLSLQKPLRVVEVSASVLAVAALGVLWKIT